MPVGVTADASAIALPRSRTSTMACSALIDSGAGGGRQLADAVARCSADCLECVGGAGKELERRHQAGGNQEGLGDLGVADGVGVCFGAVVREVDARHGGQPLESRRELLVLQPGRQESGGLGTLARSDNDEHKGHSARSRRLTPAQRRTKVP